MEQMKLEIQHIFDSGANEIRVQELFEMHLAKIRAAVADYMKSEGCECCRDYEAHEVNAARIAKLLGVPPYPDGSGFDFSPFRTESK